MKQLTDVMDAFRDWFDRMWDVKMMEHNQRSPSYQIMRASEAEERLLLALNELLQKH